LLRRGRRRRGSLRLPVPRGSGRRLRRRTRLAFAGPNFVARITHRSKVAHHALQPAHFGLSLPQLVLQPFILVRGLLQQTL
jgi:hypothetical protein